MSGGRTVNALLRLYHSRSAVNQFSFASRIPQPVEWRTAPIEFRPAKSLNKTESGFTLLNLVCVTFSDSTPGASQHAFLGDRLGIDHMIVITPNHLDCQPEPPLVDTWAP